MSRERCATATSSKVSAGWLTGLLSIHFHHLGAFVVLEKLGAYFCATGAYHEYFIARSYNQSNIPYINELFPCNTTNYFPAACYRTVFGSAFETFGKDLARILHICLHMTDIHQRQGCVHGYGLYANKFLVRGAYGMDAVCVDPFDTIALKTMCIQAVGGGLSVITTPEHKTQICSSLSLLHLRDMCMSAKNEGWNRDPELYYSVGDIPSHPPSPS
jgi:hypothetical protein